MVNSTIRPSNGYEEIKFVYACFAAESISISELQKWADSRLLMCDDADLLDYYALLSVFNGKLVQLYELTRDIVCTWDGGNKYGFALIGIAFKRGAVPFEDSPSREEALKALERYPEVEKLFRVVFPFIEF